MEDEGQRQRQETVAFKKKKKIRPQQVARLKAAGEKS